MTPPGSGAASWELDPNQVTHMAAIWPETDGVQETDRSRSLGGIAIDKIEFYRGVASQTWPRYRRGYNYNVTETMRFRIVEFPIEGGGLGYAITLVVPEDPEEYFAGWVSAARRTTAEHWVAAFNRELDELRAAWAAGGFAGRK